MLARPYVLSAVVATSIGLGACRPAQPPISIREGTMQIENRTTDEWRNVRIVVNHHFGGGAPSLAAGGRLDAPLRLLQTGHGQKFNPVRQPVFRVEVTATTADGRPVRILWPEDADGQAK
jgi:hypothetical protein